MNFGKSTLYIGLLVSLLLVGCLSCSNKQDIYANLVKENSFYKLHLEFNMKKIQQFTYEPKVLENDYNKAAFKHDDSILNSKSPLNKISGSLKLPRLVSENRAGKFKILIIHYLISGNRKVFVFDDALFDTLAPVKYSTDPVFSITKDIYSLDDIRVNPKDKEIRFLYLSNRNSDSDKKILFSNWVSLDD